METYRGYKIVIEFRYDSGHLDGKYFNTENEPARIFHYKTFEDVKEEIDELIANEE